MVRRLRRDRAGVASAVATILALLVILTFLSIAVVSVVPAQQYEAEWVTAREAMEALETLRSHAAGPAPIGARFSVPVPIGTQAVSIFATDSAGTLAFDSTDRSGPTMSFRFVPHFNQGNVQKLDQDVILLMDSSGSMRWNDPARLRISGAKEYVRQLRVPDRIAIVDFDGDAWLTKQNVGDFPHHLNAVGHNGDPDYREAETDLDTIDEDGGTNFGDAIRIANDEFSRYGDRRHQWVMILLTDGDNNFGWQDTLARQQAQRARALGIVIYTIGLGDEPDEALLAEIARTTGGTFYRAPTADSIRWIYMEISRRYSGSFACGNFGTSEITSGTLELALSTHHYPAQTYRLEGGGIGLLQEGGAAVREGMPFEYVPTGPGTGALSLTLLTFVGPPASRTGTSPEIIGATVLGRDVVDQPIIRVRLDEESRAVSNISSEVQSWADQGAATQGAAGAIRVPLNEGSSILMAGHANATAGRNGDAKFDVDRGQVKLAEALAEIDVQLARQEIQPWLARSLKDEVLVSACRLDQWRNWYDGITITIASRTAPGWAGWFNETFRALGADISIGLADDLAVLSVHGIEWLRVDHRTIRVSFGF